MPLSQVGGWAGCRNSLSGLLRWVAGCSEAPADVPLRLLPTWLPQALRLILHLGEPLPDTRYQPSVRVAAACTSPAIPPRLTCASCLRACRPVWQFPLVVNMLFFVLVFAIMCYTNGVGASTGTGAACFSLPVCMPAGVRPHALISTPNPDPACPRERCRHVCSLTGSGRRRWEAGGPPGVGCHAHDGQQAASVAHILFCHRWVKGAPEECRRVVLGGRVVQALFAGLCPDVRPVVVPLAALQAPPPSLAAALA